MNRDKILLDWVTLFVLTGALAGWVALAIALWVVAHG
jgi:hypothetical protein